MYFGIQLSLKAYLLGRFPLKRLILIFTLKVGKVKGNLITVNFFIYTEFSINFYVLGLIKMKTIVIDKNQRDVLEMVLCHSLAVEEKPEQRHSELFGVCLVIDPYVFGSRPPPGPASLPLLISQL